MVDDGHRLLGLLCLKASHRWFCADSDLIAREEGREGYRTGTRLTGTADM